MTDNTQPEAREFTMSQYASKDDMIGAMRKRIAELESELEAVGAGGVQALSAAPAGFVPVAAFDRLHAHAESLAARLLAASPTPPAEQQAQTDAVYAELPEPDFGSGRYLGKAIGDAYTKDQMRDFADRTHALRMKQAAPKAAPEVGNSGFDYKTAADFLNGKTVSDEAVRKFVAASRWAHDERAALSATLLAMHGVLTSREAEIALLKKALLEAEAAPQQEAQEPVMIYHGRCTIDCGEGGHHDMEMLRLIPKGSKLYTAPQQAPAPLSERDAFERDWEKRHAPVPINGRTHDDDGRYGDSSIQDAWESWQARAALAAQGGKDA